MSGANRRVIKPWQASRAAPISVAKGARLHLSGRVTLWEGHRWLWAANDAGAEGWVPDNLPQRENAITLARYAYSARELTCVTGQNLHVVKQTHGWAWCETAAGCDGWVPLSCLFEA